MSLWCKYCPHGRFQVYQYDNPECGIGKRCIVTCHEIVVFLPNRYNRYNPKSVISMLWFSCSVVSDSETPWTAAHQAPLSMEFSRQEYWSGLPFPFPGDLPNQGIEPRSPALQEDSLPSEPAGNPRFLTISLCKGVLTHHYKNNSAKGILQISRGNPKMCHQQLS